MYVHISTKNMTENNINNFHKRTSGPLVKMTIALSER